MKRRKYTKKKKILMIMIPISFFEKILFVVPLQISCLDTLILTAVAFEGIFPPRWTWLAHICTQGTSFSGFAAFAPDSDYPYYPHQPEPHILSSTNSILHKLEQKINYMISLSKMWGAGQFYNVCVLLTLSCSTFLYLHFTRSRKWKCGIIIL